VLINPVDRCAESLTIDDSEQQQQKKKITQEVLETAIDCAGAPYKKINKRATSAHRQRDAI